MMLDNAGASVFVNKNSFVAQLECDCSSELLKCSASDARIDLAQHFSVTS